MVRAPWQPRWWELRAAGEGRVGGGQGLVPVGAGLPNQPLSPVAAAPELEAPPLGRCLPIRKLTLCPSAALRGSAVSSLQGSTVCGPCLMGPAIE